MTKVSIRVLQEAAESKKRSAASYTQEAERLQRTAAAKRQEVESIERLARENAETAAKYNAEVAEIQQTITGLQLGEELLKTMHGGAPRGLHRRI